MSADLTDYCIIGGPSEARLSDVERLTLMGGAGLERVLRIASKQFIQGHKLPKIGRLEKEILEEAIQFYDPQRWPDQSFFPMPRPPFCERVISFHGFADGRVMDIEFNSPFRPHHPAARRYFARHKENRTAHARLWRHDQEPLATVLAIHGWTMGDQRLNSLAFLPGLLYRLGFDVAIVELPFHGRRARGGTREMVFPSVNVIRTNEGIAQAIADIRALSSILRTDRATPIGWVGISMGAYLGTLWSMLDPTAFAIPTVPLVSMSEFAWELLRSNIAEDALLSAGVTLERMRQVFAIHDPLRYSPKIDPSRVLILGGINDEMIPAHHVHLLHEHLGHPALRWCEGGHKASFEGSAIFKETVQFLEGLGFLKRGTAEQLPAADPSPKPNP